MGSAFELAAALFPEGKWGLMTFLKVYADESYDDEIYCCGSFLSWPRNFYYVGLEWDERLKKDNLTYFRASNCEGLREEFGMDNPPGYGLDQARARALSVRHDLVTLIQSKNLGGISMSISTKDFKRLVSTNLKAKEYFGEDIMIAAYKLLIKATIGLMEQDWPEARHKGLKIAFVLDKHSNWREAEEAYAQVEKEDESYARRMLVVGHADDKEYTGLQMADLMAHEARLEAKHYKNASQAERHMMSKLKKTHNVYFMGLMEEKELLEELAKYQARKAK